MYQSKYGIPAKEVENLYSRYKKHNLQEGFGNFDNFLKFASECGYKPFLHLRRNDENRPHSPENSYFYDSKAKEKLPPKKPGPKTSEIISPYCVGCKYKCPERGGGCLGWQLYFKQNWNKNICSRRKLEPPPPPKREKFQYEHPDTIRRLLAQGAEKKK